MSDNTVWLLVAQPLWNDVSTVVGAFTAETELSAAADSWRAQPTVRSTDTLCVQAWRGTLMLEQTAI